MLRRCVLRLRPEPFGGDNLHGVGYKDYMKRPEMGEEEREAVRPEVLVKDTEKIGWVGLGEMGMGMLWKVVKEPTHSVHVWTRNERKLKAYAEYLETQLQRHCFQRPILLDIPRFTDIIIVCLANIRAARDVLLHRDDAILLNAKPGTIIINHTTVDLPTTREFSELAEARGLQYLDAPIAGSPELSQTGNLTVMVGGDEMAFRRVVRVMARYAHCIEYMGASGMGTATKMIHENISAVHAVASAESALLAKTLGVTDMDKLTRVLDSSLGGSNMYRRNAMYFPAQFASKGKIVTGQTISRMAKNISILEADVLSPDLKAHLPLTTAANSIVNRCGEAGGHDSDITSVLHFLNPDNVNDTILWDVPASSPLHSQAEHSDVEEGDDHWSTVTEFDSPETQPELFSKHAPPRVDPAKLEKLYAKAKPRLAEGSIQGRTIGKAAFDPV